MSCVRVCVCVRAHVDFSLGAFRILLSEMLGTKPKALNTGRASWLSLHRSVALVHTVDDISPALP